jgi:hypothetical protein
LISGEFVAMIVAVLLTIRMVGAYAAAVGQIASSLPARYTTSVLVGAAAFNFGLAFVVSAVMGMPRRLRQAREGGSPFARHRPVTLGATPARA